MAEDKKINFNKGEIYIATCKKTQKSYVGQAHKYLSDGQKWGAKSRWARHCRDAFSSARNDYNTEIHQAIREYGKNDFELRILCKCEEKEMDELETFYIKQYNTLSPYGYNMTEGGAYGKHTESSKVKKCVPKPEISNDVKKNMSLGQIGKRYQDKERKNPGDAGLPKYVASIRQNGELLGYQIKKFPMGITEKEYIYKTFKNKHNPNEALEKAKEYVEELHKQYEEKLRIHRNEKTEEDSSRDQASKLNLDTLPENIYYLINNDRVIGYFVKGLKDCRNKEIPRREFIAHSNPVNYTHALKYIDDVNSFNSSKTLPSDWRTFELSKNKRDCDLPKHIVKLTYKGEHSGYKVNFFVGVIDGKKVSETKCFAKKSMSMEEKLNLAKKYVEELEKKYNNTE